MRLTRRKSGEFMRKLLIAAICCLLLVGCAASGDTENNSAQTESVSLHSKEIFAMDTYMTIKAYSSDNKPLESAERLIDRLEDELSVTSPESDIGRLNSAFGQEITIGDDSAELIEKSTELCERTGGALDITIYPVLREWGFTTREYQIPAKEELLSLLESVDYSKISANGNNVRLLPGQMIDLGAVAKGYTGDKIISLFKESGITSAIISLGGNVHALGSKPDGSPWKIALTDPNSPQTYIGNIEVFDKAVITSGGYERYFIGEDGKRYCHIISPFDGYPVNNGIASVTVIGDSGILCDALSTALFVMGKDAAIEHWREHNDFEMIIIEESGEITVTEGIQGSFSLLNQYEKDKLKVVTL